MIGVIGIVHGVYRDSIGVYIGDLYIGILEKKMETTIQGLGLGYSSPEVQNMRYMGTLLWFRARLHSIYLRATVRGLGDYTFHVSS